MSDMKKLKSVGLTQLYYKLPRTRFNLKELNAVKKITSSQATLKDFGFQTCFIHDNKSEFDGFITEVGKSTPTTGPPSAPRTMAARSGSSATSNLRSRTPCGRPKKKSIGWKVQPCGTKIIKMRHWRNKLCQKRFRRRI